MRSIVQDLRRRQHSFGISLEDLELILHPMAEDAKEATGSMGDDTPLQFYQINTDHFIIFLDKILVK